MKVKIIRTDNTYYDGTNYWINAEPVGGKYNDLVANLLSEAIKSGEEIDLVDYHVEDGLGKKLKTDRKESRKLRKLIRDFNSMCRKP